MEIRLLESKDIKDMAILYTDSWKKTYFGILSDEYLNSLSYEKNQKKWLDYIKNDKNGIFGYFIDGKLVGFCAFTPEQDIENCIYLDSLHINKEYQGQGIGTALIKNLASFVKLKNYKKISICILNGNEMAKKLYIKLGASHYEYFDNKLDNVIAPSEKLIWNDLGILTM